MDMQDSCIAEVALHEKNQQKRRRSSIFKPNDVRPETVTNRYPSEYKQKLTQEIEQWNKELDDAKREYLKLKGMRDKIFTRQVDTSILDQEQLDFLNEGPSCETYLKSLQDFYAKLTVYDHLQHHLVKKHEIEEQILQSKIKYAHDKIAEQLSHKE